MTSTDRCASKLETPSEVRCWHLTSIRKALRNASLALDALGGSLARLGNAQAVYKSTSGESCDGTSGLPRQGW